MPAAEPAVIDPHADGNAAAELDGEPINGDFTRRSQRVLAEELDLHGKRKKANEAERGKGRDAYGSGQKADSYTRFDDVTPAQVSVNGRQKLFWKSCFLRS